MNSLQHMLSRFPSRLFLQLFLLGLLLSLALGIGTLNAAWNTPSAAPPQNNTDAPLNVATGVQTKAGGLQMSTLDILGTNGLTLKSGQLSFWDTGTIVDPAYTIDMDALDPAATNGIRFPDGTVQVSAAPTTTGANLTGITSYTTAGSYTWTKPAGLKYVVVEVWGGGGGGQGKGATLSGIRGGGAGGTSSFGAYLSATGGDSGPANNLVDVIGGVGSGGNVNLRGGQGSNVAVASGDYNAGGNGGAAPRGGLGGSGGGYGGAAGSSGTGPGGGGGGGGNDFYPGAGGAGGGYSLRYIDAASLTGTVAVQVGAGGNGGGSAGTGQGGDGATGRVTMYTYQ